MPNSLRAGGGGGGGAALIGPRDREVQWGLPGPKTLAATIGAQIIANTILGVPDYDYSIMGPETLFYLLRPQH